MASPGYNNEVAQGDASGDVHSLMKAMSGLRKDHSTIIGILARADPARMALLRQTYAQRNGSATLESKVDGMRGHYGDTLVQMVRGPLVADAHNVNRAIKGLGTKEDQLNDVLVGRSNADMRAIKLTYQQIFKRTMELDVEGDLSLKTKTMFQLMMRASRTEENYPYNPTEIARDAEALHHATRGPSIATNSDQVIAILTQRSDNQIRAIATEYQRNFGKNLEDTIRSSFSGHMEDALLLALGRATDRAKTDAYGLEDSMKGLGTKDDLLVQRTVRIHWDRQHRDQVKRAYDHFFKKDLIKRVRGETSGDYRDALVACLT
jgi:annexin A7/11